MLPYSDKTPLLAAFDGNLSQTSSWTAAELESWRASMQQTHDSERNLSYAWRIKQLTAMRQMITENAELFIEALHKDLGKEKVEAIATEINQILAEITYFRNNLRTLMKKKHISTPLAFAPAFTWVEKRPLLGPGVLVIGPSNYPLSLSCQPAVGSLAAGNPTMIRPSELCPAVAHALATLVPRYFDSSDCRVVLAEVEQTKLLLQYPWGTVFFTGSAQVGKLVAQQTALTLTPTILELGGKSPCYIDGETCSSLDWKMVANRIVWCKLINTGQTCCAIDYLIIPQDKLDLILDHLKEALLKQFGPDLFQGELGRMLKAEPHARRQVDIIKELETISAAATAIDSNNNKPPCQIVTGGSALCRPDERYICPTLVVNPPLESRAMKEEIFGPILPILTVSSRQEAIDLLRKMQSVGGTPLCLYVFTSSSKVFSEMTRACRAGSVVRNDGIVHLSNTEVPFGGLGQSGIGKYHGPHSFDALSQSLPCMYRPLIPGVDLNFIRGHPFGTGFKMNLILFALQLPPTPVLIPQSDAFKWTVGILGVSVVLAKLAPSAAGFVLQPLLSVVASGLEQLASFLKGTNEP